MTDIGATIIQIEFLKMQIDLEETNYKYAVELQKDYDMLRRMRDNIKKLREELQLQEKIVRESNIIS